MSYNKCIFIGNMQSKKMLETKSGKPMLLFTIRVWDKKDNAEFIDCVSYSDQAELIDRDFPEKRQIFIECKAHTYKDKEGKKQTQFVVEKFEYCSDRMTA